MIDGFVHSLIYVFIYLFFILHTLIHSIIDLFLVVYLFVLFACLLGCLFVHFLIAGLFMHVWIFHLSSIYLFSVACIYFHQSKM